MLESTKKYLDRKNADLHDNILEENKNFLSIFRYIISTPTKNKEFKNALQEKIKNPLSVLDKKWILEKFIL